MSVSKWAYEPWKCDGEYCPNDCDHCYKANIEADGDVTWDGLTDDNERISETISKDDGRG